MNARNNEVHDELETEGREVATTNEMVSLIAAAEIDQQIATAHKYPRSVATFRKEALQMVTLTEVIAQECIYALKRGDKVIQGPSARFAEIIFSAWGNSRAGARIVHEGPEFVTAQGVCQDLQRNTAITFEVQRRITDSKGKRYGADMIGVTANAASSIALRNSILKVIPKAFWSELYTAALKVGVGDVKTLANKRLEAIAAFQHYGVTEAQILAKLGRSGVQDISLDDLLILFGLLTAIKDNETTPEEAFSLDAGTRPAVTMPTEKKVEPQAESAKPLEGEVQTKSEQAQPKGKAEPAKKSQIDMIRTKAKQATITVDEISKRFNLPPTESNSDPLAGITTIQAQEILAFIANPAG